VLQGVAEGQKPCGLCPLVTPGTPFTTGAPGMLVPPLSASLSRRGRLLSRNARYRRGRVSLDRRCLVALGDYSEHPPKGCSPLVASHRGPLTLFAGGGVTLPARGSLSPQCRASPPHPFYTPAAGFRLGQRLPSAGTCPRLPRLYRLSSCQSRGGCLVNVPIWGCVPLAYPFSESAPSVRYRYRAAGIQRAAPQLYTPLPSVSTPHMRFFKKKFDTHCHTCTFVQCVKPCRWITFA